VTSYPGTESQVWFNRNVAQHNVVMANPWSGGYSVFPVDVRSAITQPYAAGLAVIASGTPFIGTGTLVIDLGQTLAQRWIASGAQGEGIERVGTTQIQITNPQQADILGLTLDPGDDFTISLDFGAGSTPAGKQYTEELVQTDSQGNVNGGVDYRLVAAS
jgi:hypothetical protein